MSDKDNKTQKVERAKRNHDRSVDQTAISVSLDRYTLRLLEKAAKEAGRTRSNYIRWIINRTVPPI